MGSPSLMCAEESSLLSQRSPPPSHARRPHCLGRFASREGAEFISGLGRMEYRTNHSLLLFIHIAKTAGTLTTATLRRYKAKLAAVPCVSPLQLACDSSDAWQHRHLYLEFHDGQRVFGPRVAPLLPALRRRYRESGGRVLLWMSVRPVLPRSFSHFYMWSSEVVRGQNGRRSKRQLSFDEWTRRHGAPPSMNAHVSGLGLGINTTGCERPALAAAIRMFDVLVHMDCTSEFLTRLLKSLTGKQNNTRVGWLSPGTGVESRANRTQYKWATISACTRQRLLDLTWCDARFYSMVFPDDPSHRRGWWRQLLDDPKVDASTLFGPSP